VLIVLRSAREYFFFRLSRHDAEQEVFPRPDLTTLDTRSRQAENVLALAGRFAQRGGGMGQVLDVDARQRGGEGVFGFSQRRQSPPC